MYTNIYILLDENDYVFYVGQTNNPTGRQHQHRGRFGDNIKLEVIDTVIYPYANFFEAHYLHLYKSWGFVLKNKSLLLNIEAPTHSPEWYKDKILNGKYKEGLALVDVEVQKEKQFLACKKAQKELLEKVKNMDVQIKNWQAMYKERSEGGEVEKLKDIIWEQDKRIRQLEAINAVLIKRKPTKKRKKRIINKIQIKLQFPKEKPKRREKTMKISDIKRLTKKEILWGIS